MTKIATWNVNSLRQRLEHVLDWLRDEHIDIALLQETKVEDHLFPTLELEQAGYHLAFTGQKTFNGVAIISRFPLSDIRTTLPGNEADEQQRYIEAIADTPNGALRVVSVYVPNGQAPDSDKFVYKMNFFAHLRQHLANLLQDDAPLVVGGDYNVAPEPLDVHDPQKWHGQVCFHPQEREHFRSLRWLGLTDAFRHMNPSAPGYSWWDYRMKQFERDDGLRIDHLLLSANAADRLIASDVDRKPREREKPSDHTPVWCQFADA